MSCRIHGADLEPRILAIVPCPPGWLIAHRPCTSDDNTVWTSPIAAWAHTEDTGGLCAGCTCVQRRVTAMLAGEYGDLDLADDNTHVVPPGWRAEWSDDAGWALREVIPDELPSRIRKRSASK